MAEAQPPTVVEGATTGDVDDEIPVTAKSAEDRKAAAALSSLETREDDSRLARDLDQEAVRKAVDRLAVTNGTATKKEDDKKTVKKSFKADPEAVTLLISEMEVTKSKATDMLKTYDGDVDALIKAWVHTIGDS